MMLEMPYKLENRSNILTMKLRALFSSALMILLSAAVCAQPGKSSFSDLAAKAPELVQMQNEFEQTVPPGVSIQAREISRKGTSGKDLTVVYNIYVRGVPRDTVFRQVQFPVDRDKAVAGIDGITLNSNGLMICAGRTPAQCHNGGKLDDPVLFTQQLPLKGEPRRSVFLAENLRIPISLVPDPIRSEDKGCKLSAVRLTAKFELAYITGSGFRPNTDVHIQLADDRNAGISVIDSDGGISSPHPGTTIVTVRSDSNGAIQTATLPNTSRNPEGQETVEVVDPNCGPKITYEWGVF
jgi:hypothetical protein